MTSARAGHVYIIDETILFGGIVDFDEWPASLLGIGIGVFTEADLTGFATATAPESQFASHQRHGVMEKAHSKKGNYS